MHYYIYEIKNKINGKVYVGVHKTTSLDDGYMGSGKLITRAIKKYGIENFTKTILEEFNTQEEMFAREKELVDGNFLSREDVYNLRLGGFGGFDYINTNILTIEDRVKNGQLGGVYGKHFSSSYNPSKHMIYITNGIIDKKIMPEDKIPEGFYRGRTNGIPKITTHSEESLQKMREAGKLRIGSKNSQFGSIWITNGIENKKVKKDSIVPEGWYKGRTQK